MHVFFEVLQLLGIWGLGYFTCSANTKEKAKRLARRNAQYKIVTNSLYGKKPANVQVPRHLNGTVCLDPATCKEHDAVSKYPDIYRDDYIREFERGNDSTQGF